MISIRPYDPSMQSDIERVYRAYMGDLGITYDALDRHHDVASIPASYMDTGCFWGLVDRGDLIGMVAVRALDPARTRAELKRLYVVPARQGQGYGEALFARAMSFAKAQGFSKILLDTRRDRVAAHRLFRKFGFIETARYNDNVQAELFFERDLAGYRPYPLRVLFPTRIPANPDFAVIAARFNGRWVYVRNKERETLELPGGHVEPGETAEEAARRELYEETGAVEFSLSPITPYGIASDEAVSAGMLYFAEITRFGSLPDYEIAERVLTDRLPDRLTYPAIQPRLMDRTQEWLQRGVT